MLLMFGIALVGCAQANAQRRAPPALAFDSMQSPVAGVRASADAAGTDSRSARAPASTIRLVLGGAAGALYGLYLGGYAGAHIDRWGERAGHWDPCYECWLTTRVVVGGLIGETLLLPLGVHLANGRRGSYRESALSSLLVAAIGLGAAFPTSGAALIAVPLVQLHTSIRDERNTAVVPVPPNAATPP